MSRLSQEAQLWWRALVKPIVLAMYRAGIGELRIVRTGTRCVFELVPEGQQARDVSPPADGSADSDKSDQVRPVCEACGGPGPLSEVTEKLWPPHLCASCVRTYSERVGKAAPPATG